MQQDKEFLGKAPIGKLLFQLALPAIAAQIINLLYNLVDRCMPVIMIVSAFAALVSMGGAPRASIFMGKKDNETAEKILGNSFMLQIVISVILTTILLLFNRPLLLKFGASPETIGYATAYMNIYAVGTIFVQLTLGMNAFITAQGFAKTGMLSVLIGAVTNIILDPIFIYGFGMGVRGAALATVISQALSTIWVLSFLMGKKTHLKIRRKNLKMSGKILLPCIALGLSPFVMQASESVIMVCFNSSLLKYGGNIAVGAMTILSSVMQFSMLPLQGLAQPISSYNYGAGNGARVKKTFWLLLACSLIYSGALWLAIMFFPELFARIFSPDAELIAFTGTALRVYMGCLVLMGAQIACQMTFISLGNAAASIVVAHLMEDQTMAVYTAEPVADFLAVTFTVCLFAVQFKKALKKLE